VIPSYAYVTSSLSCVIVFSTFLNLEKDAGFVDGVVFVFFMAQQIRAETEKVLDNYLLMPDPIP
jgi:hypothetical protein